MMEKILRENAALWSLFGAITAIESVEQCSRFFRDLCTLTELQAVAERWEVARLVTQKVPYREISRRTGVSTATVTRVAHWVRFGEGGYRSVLAANTPVSLESTS